MTDIELGKQMRAAILAGNLTQVRELLDRTPELLHRMTAFGTWLHVAAEEGHQEIATELINRGAQVDARGGTFDGAALKLAASAGHLAMVRLLLDAGSTLDVTEPERNPLFGAIYGGHLDVVKLLIERGLDHRIRYSGRSMNNMDAKAFALERGQSEIARFLNSLN